MFGEKIAVKLEVVARRALNVKNKDGMAGVISVDFIANNRGAFTVICAALAPYYLNATKEERIPLDDIIARYRHLPNCSNEEYFKSTEQATEELKALLNDLGVQDYE
ncbi:hypothetical protein [Radiobacillus sp. PE A8.2]|uniref:hypothetical protein n=1 Tax=Radiobacillus sp. PE A8.2 TaxID=3380349 RepID=UPI00389028E1